MVYKRLNNSVFIINVVIMFYLFILQVINPLKGCMVYPYEFFSVTYIIRKGGVYNDF